MKRQILVGESRGSREERVLLDRSHPEAADGCLSGTGIDR